MASGALYGTDLPLREPEHTCEACGALGTIGRAVRFNDDSSVRELHRFCRSCWPEQSARYRARWAEEDRLATEAFFRNPIAGGLSCPSMALEAATWHGALEVLQMVHSRLKPQTPPSAKELAAIAAQWKAIASQLDEPMPMEIETFIRQYGALANEQLYLTARLSRWVERVASWCFLIVSRARRAARRS
jgi:hypothetical protein